MHYYLLRTKVSCFTLDGALRLKLFINIFRILIFSLTLVGAG